MEPGLLVFYLQSLWFYMEFNFIVFLSRLEFLLFEDKSHFIFVNTS